MKKRNLRIPETDIDIDETLDVDVESSDPRGVAPWYAQLLKLDARKRKAVVDTALKRIKESKPEAFEFIRKFDCELVGITPGVEYTLVSDAQGELEVTFVHPYSMPTLLYWCKQGGFGFFVNANLEYNDTVLNRIAGNKVDKGIRGFTG